MINDQLKFLLGFSVRALQLWPCDMFPLKSCLLRKHVYYVSVLYFENASCSENERGHWWRVKLKDQRRKCVASDFNPNNQRMRLQILLTGHLRWVQSSAVSIKNHEPLMRLREIDRNARKLIRFHSDQSQLSVIHGPVIASTVWWNTWMPCHIHPTGTLTIKICWNSICERLERKQERVLSACITQDHFRSSASFNSTLLNTQISLTPTTT